MKDASGFSIHSDARESSQSENEERSHKPSFWADETSDRALAGLILERTSDLVAITSFAVSPRYVYLSPSHKRILGYDASELLNTCPFDVIHPDDAQRLVRLLAEYVTSLSRENGSPSDLKLPTERLVYRIRDKSGNWHFLETTGDLLADDLILFISRDVTERVKAERDLYESRMLLQTKVEERTRELTSTNAALRESERRYRNILTSIEDGYYEVDLAGNMIFFNDALCRITGYSPDELRGMNNREYSEPETAKRMFEIFNRVYRTGEPSRIDDYVVVKKDGAKCTVQLSTSLIRDWSGRAIGFRGIARDVTERRLARRALEESEAKYRTILQSIEDGYYEVDIKGDFVFFNESMCKILGYSPNDLKGLNNRKFMSEETARTVYNTFNEVYSTGQPTKVLGWELVRKDGQKRYVETSVSLIRNEKEEPIGFRGIARDITEQKELEKARERIINHLSHELGTPLSIIGCALGRISKAIEKADLNKIEEWVERAGRNVGRLKDLKEKVDDILKGSAEEEREKALHFVETVLWMLEEIKEEPLKENADAIRRAIVEQLDPLYKMEDLETEPIQLDTFLDEVCAEANQLMKQRQIEIVKVFDKGICVEMNRKVMKKVCDGFLRNAVENTPDEGKIEITVKSADHTARVDFHDFGIGITSENEKLIFGGFFHTQDTFDYTSKEPYLFNAGGSGCDLLRAKVLSERFHFSVDFSSHRCRYLPTDKHQCPGKISSCGFIGKREECLASGGSTFSLSFPLKGQG
jgi:PAS domain S-box-containing protein